MIPRILERDGILYPRPPVYLAWCTTAQSMQGSSYSVRSDGQVYQDYGVMNSRAAQVAVAAGSCICNGIHLAGALGGDQFTPYMVVCHAMCEDVEMRPFLFVAESPVSPTTSAAGDVCADVAYLAFGTSPTTKQGGMLSYQKIVLLEEDVVDRGVCFGVGLVSGTTTSGTRGAHVNLQVRRLVLPQPQVFDVRKQ